MEGIKRFYVVSNHTPGFIRAWHYHDREEKYVFPVSGTAVLAAVEIDDKENPSKDLAIHRFVLSAEKPAILHIPAGFAHGSLTITAHTRLVFFSTSTLQESKEDDIRYPSHYWDPWTVESR